MFLKNARNLEGFKLADVVQWVIRLENILEFLSKDGNHHTQVKRNWSYLKLWKETSANERWNVHGTKFDNLVVLNLVLINVQSYTHYHLCFYPYYR